MKMTRLMTLTLLLAIAGAHAQELKSGTVYSYVKDGVKYYSAKPPPSGSSDARTIKYSFITQNALTGTWVEKAGNATYTFGDGYNFEFHLAPNPRVLGDFGTVGKGIWTLAPDSCSVGSTKGNLYIQSGTDRCCHSAYFLGNNLVLTAIVRPQFIGVCSDRVLVRQESQ